MSAYPKWITRDDGASLIVSDHIQHSEHMQRLFGPDGKELVVRPPTIESLQAHGYSEAAAKRIAFREQQKCDQGITPYGSKPECEFKEVGFPPESIPDTETVKAGVLGVKPDSAPAPKPRGRRGKG